MAEIFCHTFFLVNGYSIMNLTGAMGLLFEIGLLGKWQGRIEMRNKIEVNE